MRGKGGSDSKGTEEARGAIEAVGIEFLGRGPWAVGARTIAEAKVGARAAAEDEENNLNEFATLSRIIENFVGN